jgi:hypothetical protein
VLQYARQKSEINTMQRLNITLTAMSLLLAAAGCGRGDGLTRVVVSGNVSLDGTPVEDGQIRYIPVDATAGPVTIAPIRQGIYVCDARGGVPVGKHRVEILVWDPKVPQPKGPGGDPRPQWAQPKFNTKSELTAVIEEGDGTFTNDFKL